MKKLHILCTLVFLLISTQIQAKTLIISDIDDTLRQSNVVDKPDAVRRLMGNPEPFKGLRELFHTLRKQADLKGEELPISYISASIPFLYKAEKWLNERGFPAGEVTQRESLFDDTYKYKVDAISRFLDKNHTSGDLVFFFGDNSELDAKIYKDVISKYGINGEVYIRDVRGNASIYSPKRNGNRVKGVTYFASELELILLTPFKLVAGKLKYKLNQYLEAGNSIPNYVKKRIRSQLKPCRFSRFSPKYYLCQREATKLLNFWMAKVNSSLQRALGLKDLWLMTGPGKVETVHAIGNR